MTNPAHTIPLLSGTFDIPARLAHRPKMPKKPSSPSRSNTRTERQCINEQFDYLNYAYIDGRYRSEEEFPVTKEQLDYWSTEAKKLLELTEQICNEKIEQLKEIEEKAAK